MFRYAIGTETLEHPGQERISRLGSAVFYAYQAHTDEWNNWCLARSLIDEELTKYYRACTTGDLPPQLLALSKKLDEELLKPRPIAPLPDVVSRRPGQPS